MEKLDRKHNDYRPVYALLGLFCLAGVVVLAACLLNRQSMPLVGRELNADEREEVIARNSPLTQYVYLTANAAFPRERQIDTITIHHMAGAPGLGKPGGRVRQGRPESLGQLRHRRQRPDRPVRGRGQPGLDLQQCGKRQPGRYHRGG